MLATLNEAELFQGFMPVYDIYFALIAVPTDFYVDVDESVAKYIPHLEKALKLYLGAVQGATPTLVASTKD